MCAIRQINLVNTGRLNEFGYGTFLWVFVAGHFWRPCQYAAYGAADCKAW
jgi:hypothetical protein